MSKVMKREIKFRGKSKTDGEWFYGNLFDKDTSGRTHICTTKKGCLDIDPDTIGQYTGLKDKNGKEIYEGDIVKAPYLDPIFGGVVNNMFVNIVVGYNKGSFVLEYDGNLRFYISDLYDNIEVIGNIYDNPELLTEK